MKTHKLQVKHFISEDILAHFDTSPLHRKSPHCPNAFTWRGERKMVTKCLAEWKDFTRKGRMARNMQPQHAAVASRRGSWGVGRFYFDVETDTGACFRIYYDRAPKDASDREGHWVVLAELDQEKD